MVVYLCLSPGIDWLSDCGSKIQITFVLHILCHRYLGKEGWAPASYLKKLKDDLSLRKKTLTGPVEIIGNIMEISNLLNKKAVSEKDVQTDGEATTPDRHISKSEISLPMPCAPEVDQASMTASIAPKTVLQSACSAALQDTKPKAEPGSPAIARVAPHRVEIGKNLYKANLFFFNRLFFSSACNLT